VVHIPRNFLVEPGISGLYEKLSRRARGTLGVSEITGAKNLVPAMDKHPDRNGDHGD
jgi:hypothetical protein